MGTLSLPDPIVGFKLLGTNVKNKFITRIGNAIFLCKKDIRINTYDCIVSKLINNKQNPHLLNKI